MDLNNIKRFFIRNIKILKGIFIWFIFLLVCILFSLSSFLIILIPTIIVALYCFCIYKFPHYLSIKIIYKKYGQSKGSTLLKYFYTYIKIDEDDSLDEKTFEKYINILSRSVVDEYGAGAINELNRFIKDNRENYQLINDLEQADFPYYSYASLDYIYEEKREYDKVIQLINQKNNALEQLYSLSKKFFSLSSKVRDEVLSIMSVLSSDEYYYKSRKSYSMKKATFDSIPFDCISLDYDMLDYITPEDRTNVQVIYHSIQFQLQEKQINESKEKMHDNLQEKNNVKKDPKQQEIQRKENAARLSAASDAARTLSVFNRIIITECKGKGLEEIRSLLSCFSEEKVHFLKADDYSHASSQKYIPTAIANIAKSINKSKKKYLIIDELYDFTLIKDFDSELFKMILKCTDDEQLRIFAFSKTNLRKLRLSDSLDMFEVCTEEEFLNQIKNKTKNRTSVTNLSQIDKMVDGHSFEEYAASILSKNGYKNVRVTPASGDQGIDILAENNGISFGIQCKCYSNDVGNKAVQEAFAGAKYYDCQVAVVLTNRFFTPAAKDAAKKMNVVLWDRHELEKLLKNARE